MQELLKSKKKHLALGYLANEDKNDGITITSKSNEVAECSYISLCEQHGYRRLKTRVLLARNQSSIV